MKQKTVYYSDEQNDEFSTAHITPKRIDGSYDYRISGFGNGLKHFFLYSVVARPIAALFLKLKYHHRIVGGDVIKRFIRENAAGRGGFYLYGNHTNPVADALIPSMLAFPRDARVIVHPNNVSMPVLGRLTPYLGAIPLPDDREAMKNFQGAVKKVVDGGNALVIYPEAHIWPYFTGIRNFRDASFRYPAADGRPVFCFTNTYQKKRHGSGVRMTTYVDGPFFSQAQQASMPEKRASLRNQAYKAMKLRSLNNTVELVRYVKKEK
jgi:1-acyl-sn-glycerol-3-phosphate acyltransferase